MAETIEIGGHIYRVENGFNLFAKNSLSAKFGRLYAEAKGIEIDELQKTDWEAEALAWVTQNWDDRRIMEIIVNAAFSPQGTAPPLSRTIDEQPDVTEKHGRYIEERCTFFTESIARHWKSIGTTDGSTGKVKSTNRKKNRAVT